MLLALGIAACASLELNDAECRSTNWSERGREDARAGHPSQLVRLRQQCASHGVQIDQRAYLEGYRVGYDEWDRLMGSMRSR
jgi:hypothetical protein